jgi:hypothetical protein
MFENRILRRIFGPKRDEVTGEWRKLNNEELHNLYSSPDIIRQVTSRRMRWVGHVAHMGGQKIVQGFGGKARGKETTWKTKDLRRLAWGGVDWIRLAQDRDRWQAVVSAVMKFQVLAP